MNTSISAIQTKLQENPVQKKVLTLEATKRTINKAFLIFWLVSTVFLLLRVLLEGLGSNPHSLFALFIYLVSGVFLLPFFGMFSSSQNSLVPDVASFDGTALLAILCYSILILLGSAVLYLIVRILKTNKQVQVTTKTNKPIDPTLSEDILS